MIWKFLGMFVSTLTADDKYSLLNRDNLRQPIQMPFSQQQRNIFSISLCIFKICTKFWPFSKKHDPDVFPKLQTPKNVAEKISKMSSFRGHLDKQHAKGDETLLKSEWHYLLSYLLLTVRQFVDILTADDKYSLLNRYNLRQPIQIQLSQKLKPFSNLFLHFWKWD